MPTTSRAPRVAIAHPQQRLRLPQTTRSPHTPVTQAPTPLEQELREYVRLARRAQRTVLEDEYLTLVRAVGLPEPAAQYQFHRPRRWAFDYCWPRYGIAVELEGGVYSGGRHVRGKGYEADCHKYNQAAIDGWLVLRFTAGMLDDGRAVEMTQAALDAQRARGREIA